MIDGLKTSKKRDKTLLKNRFSTACSMLPSPLKKTGDFFQRIKQEWARRWKRIKKFIIFCLNDMLCLFWEDFLQRIKQERARRWKMD